MNAYRRHSAAVGRLWEMQQEEDEKWVRVAIVDLDHTPHHRTYPR